MRRRIGVATGVASVLALVGVLFAPTLAWLWRSWLGDPYYSHGVLMPPLALALAWRARGRLGDAAPDAAGLALIAAGAAVHLVALRWGIGRVSAAGRRVVLVGVGVALTGRRLLGVVALPAVVLALAIPVPWVEDLAPPLASGAADAAAGVAGALGIAVVRNGAQLGVGDGAFVVGGPCSGLRSLVALVTLAVVIAGVSNLPPVRRVLLVAAALPLAFAANWLRLTSLILAADAVGVVRGLDVFHLVAGPVLYATAIAGLVSFGRVLAGARHGV